MQVISKDNFDVWTGVHFVCVCQKLEEEREIDSDMLVPWYFFYREEAAIITLVITFIINHSIIILA